MEVWCLHVCLWGWTEGSSWPVMGLPIACEWYSEGAMAIWSNTETLSMLEKVNWGEFSRAKPGICFSVLCNRPQEPKLKDML